MSSLLSQIPEDLRVELFKHLKTIQDVDHKEKVPSEHEYRLENEILKKIIGDFYSDKMTFNVDNVNECSFCGKYYDSYGDDLEYCAIKCGSKSPCICLPCFERHFQGKCCDCGINEMSPLCYYCILKLYPDNKIPDKCFLPYVNPQLHNGMCSHCIKVKWPELILDLSDIEEQDPDCDEKVEDEEGSNHD